MTCSGSLLTSLHGCFCCIPTQLCSIPYSLLRMALGLLTLQLPPYQFHLFLRRWLCCLLWQSLSFGVECFYFLRADIRLRPAALMTSSEGARLVALSILVPLHLACPPGLLPLYHSPSTVNAARSVSCQARVYMCTLLLVVLRLFRRPVLDLSAMLYTRRAVMPERICARAFTRAMPRWLATSCIVSCGLHLCSGSSDVHTLSLIRVCPCSNIS